MLEFQEGFFEQEVRDGFYLDVTIKTLWASEMELLNKIAEVCAKYELKWYAAYGTLLGAIRHEGFVPWDDDMDIWMMRKDYNKLMKVLPKELPEGYRVRSVLTEIGYDQFHTCVNNGSGISIAKDWLEANHNCPFTVGIDIFPLDYLPRNKKDRELQKSIFILVGRVAQVAKNIHRGDFDNEDATMTKEEAIAQVKEGLKYLKKNYKFNLDMNWIKNEEWDKVASEVWKWGNYVASMYEEDESDYIVEYLDWARWDFKKFPKEWFGEVYSAEFENVYLPIPCEYDKILTTTYGDYMYFVPKTGMHEYPFYARQLRQLKEYVNDVEKRADDIGLIEIDKIELNDKHNIPDKWVPYTKKSDGSKKRIILMANNISEYINYGSEAIDKLEKILSHFRTLKESILLWWRPHPMIETVLQNIDKSLASRYRDLLDNYKFEGWGICDESDDTECAVEACDAYYGEMNAIVQNVQNYPKPVMITQLHLDEKAQLNNQEVERINRSFFAYSDSIEIEGKRYFSNNSFNALVIINADNEILDIIAFEDEELTAKNLHLKCVAVDAKILFLPSESNKAHVYDIKTGQQKSFILSDKKSERFYDYWDYITVKNDIYLLPFTGNQHLQKWSPEKNDIEIIEWWGIKEEGIVKNIRIDDTQFATLVYNTNILYITDVTTETISKFSLPVDNVVSIQYDGKYIWFVRDRIAKLYKWNIEDNVYAMYEIPENDIVKFRDGRYLNSLSCIGNEVLFISQGGRLIYSFNSLKEDLRVIINNELEDNFLAQENQGFFSIINNSIILKYVAVDKEYIIDKDDLTVKEQRIKFGLSVKAQKYKNRVLVERNVLLYELQDEYGLDMLLE